MKTKKINIELSLSRNYDKVSISFLDEPIEFEDEKELREGIRKRFEILRSEINREFSKIQGGEDEN